MAKDKPLYPNWSVQKAVSIERRRIPDGAEFWVTEKLNGVRATFYKGRLISRSGRALNGLDHIVDCLKEKIDYGHAVDGELVLCDCGEMTNNQAFSTTVGIINSDGNECEKKRICFNVFDYIPNFSEDDPSMTYRRRRELMDSLIFSETDPVKIVPVLYHGTDQSEIDRLLEVAIELDKEGLIVNLDAPYMKARSTGILKVKRFYTMDLPIIGFTKGTGRLGDKLGALIVVYGDTPVGVGTGFTDEERYDIWSRRNELVGVLCEVKYKDVTFDKTSGRASLQFPVFVRLREDKTDISYD